MTASDSPAFATSLEVVGPLRAPAQMLGRQEYDGHVSVHDDHTAATLGLRGAPIEGPTHFSQFDPIGALIWGQQWFEAGCVSAHFQTMVVQGEKVRAVASIDSLALDCVRVRSLKANDEPVLSGTVCLSTSPHVTETLRRASSLRPVNRLFILDEIEVGMETDDVEASIDRHTPNGALYPFSLAQKLDSITEPHPWYLEDGSSFSPWRRAILPFEMVSVLALKGGQPFSVRTPSIGLILDLEVRMLRGPLFVGEKYWVRHKVLGVSEGRKVESYWTKSTIAGSRGATEVVAEVLLHSGYFKASYPGHPEAANSRRQ